jgi:hypothetical protein
VSRRIMRKAERANDARRSISSAMKAEEQRLDCDAMMKLASQARAPKERRSDPLAMAVRFCLQHGGQATDATLCSSAGDVALCERRVGLAVLAVSSSPTFQIVGAMWPTQVVSCVCCLLCRLLLLWCFRGRNLRHFARRANASGPEQEGGGGWTVGHTAGHATAAAISSGRHEGQYAGTRKSHHRRAPVFAGRNLCPSPRSCFFSFLGLLTPRAALCCASV